LNIGAKCCFNTVLLQQVGIAHAVRRIALCRLESAYGFLAFWLCLRVDVIWCCCCCAQVTGTLLKGYRARFKGAPLSSTVNYLKQYVAVSAARSDVCHSATLSLFELTDT
jgi:hypothetical protein